MALPEDRKPLPQADAESQDMRRLLEGLEATNARERASSARDLYRQGSELARQATEAWFRDAELASCFVLGASGFPEATVGIAVEPTRFATIHKANGSPRLREVPPDIDAQEFELDFSGNVRIDILTTRDARSEGAIARFLKRNGEGIQQVELAVRDVDRATERLANRWGLEAVYPEAREGADGTQVNFLLVEVPGATAKKKVLIELLGNPRAHLP